MNKRVLFLTIPLFLFIVFVFFKLTLVGKPSSNFPVSTSNPSRPIRVLVLDFNLKIPSQNNRRVRDIMRWANPKNLEQQYISDVSSLSNGVVNYQIVDRIDNIDSLLEKQDGYLYSPDEYLQVARNTTPHHEPDIINYNKLLQEYQICEKVNQNQIDELWLWGGPWVGFYEAVMAGNGAIYTNAPPIPNTTCKRPLNIMGFSYERGVSEMLEDLGHRTEGVMFVKFGEDPRWIKSTSTDWGKFVASHGWMHQPPNVLYSAKHYVYNDPSTFPISCSVWGCTNYGFKKWWFTNLPPEWWAYLLPTD